MDPRQNLPPETEAGVSAAYPKRRPPLPQIGVGVSSRGPRVRGPPYGANLYPSPLLHMDLPLLVWMTQGLVHQRKVNFCDQFVNLYSFVHIKNTFIGLFCHIFGYFNVCEADFIFHFFLSVFYRVHLYTYYVSWLGLLLNNYLLTLAHRTNIVVEDAHVFFLNIEIEIQLLKILRIFNFFF